MVIKSVEVIAFAIPLKKPARIATRDLLVREYVLAKIRTDEGTEGIGYIYSGTKGARIVTTVIEELFTPYLLGKDPHLISAHWDAMYQEALLLGRRGAVLRAISCLDIALWDLLGKMCQQPLFRLLGGNKSIVPAYASCGYYREGNELDALEKELGAYMALGFADFKIRVGGLPLEEDLKRVSIARSTIGPKARLALDANNAYKSVSEAVRAARSFEPFDIWWFEEPLTPDDTPGLSAVAATINIPVATGEIEATRFGFRDLIMQKSASILQPDVGVLGGITEWMRVAHTAASFGIPVAPHWHANLHVHLVGAVTNGLAVEYFLLDDDIYNFEQVVLDRLQPSGGKIMIPEKPGLGIEINEHAIRNFRIG